MAKKTEANYKVTIESVSKELTTKERIQLKDLSDAQRLDKLTQVEPVFINVDFYATLSVHNEKSDDKDYKNYVVVAKDGTRYVTGSQSFITAFEDIMDEISDSGEEIELVVKVYRLPSKNREGKDFITCSLA